jgi:universal stress protein E
MADKKILVVVDPTTDEKQPVIERAAWLAERASATLELFVCDYDPEIDAGQVSTIWIPQPARDNLIEIHRKSLETLAEHLRKRGLEVTVDVAWDHPLGEGIVRKVAESKPWLVAKDTHHHNVLKRTVLSNTDWHLIRGCPAPLLLVKPRALAKKPKVFAAVDPVHEHDKPAQLDDKIFELANSLSKLAGGEVHVVHTYAAPMALEFPDDIVSAIEQQHHQAMNAFLSKHKVPEANVHLVEGRPEQWLPRITESDSADFVVMGAVSRRGLDRLFLGNTAERVLDRLPCDVVVVKPEGFKPSLPHAT